jgi:hypothetical protein
VPNANWSNPTTASLVANFVTEVKARDEDLALQFDGTSTSYTNIPTGTIRWNSTINRWQKWSGTAWGELTTTYALTGLSTTGAASVGTDLSFNSGYGSAATAYGCRAWGAYNGAAATSRPTLPAGNISSYGKSGTGNYTVNFATAMVDLNYAVALGGTYENSGSYAYRPSLLSLATTNFQILNATTTTTATLGDAVVLTFAVFR